MTQDGSVKIAVEVDGKQVDTASKSLDNLETSGNQAGKGVKQTEDGLKKVGNESNKASGNIKKFATALGLVAIGAAAFNELKNAMASAISRFDTLSNFPRVLQALGVSAEDSEASINRLSSGIDGLPTKLDDIASNAQRMYSSFNDIDKATESALALNNALLGSGSSADDAQRGTDQYLQALQRGKFEMEEWKTLQETMDVGLIKVAESFGFAGKSAKDDLYKAMQDGSITMDEFNDKLIEVGTGTGEMAKLAKTNSQGIATSLGNLRNAAARGIANIIQSFDKLSKEVTGKNIAENIDGMKNVVTASFSVIGSVIEGTAPVVKVFAGVIRELLPIVEPLTPALIGLATAAAGLMIVKGLGTAMTSFKTVVMGVTVVQKAATVVTAASAVAYNTLTGRVVAARVAQTTLAIATKGLRTAMLAMTGPVGWATLGIGALAGAVVGIVKWFNKSSDEAEKLQGETEELGEATDDLNKSLDDSSKAYKDNQKSIDETSQSNEKLAEQIDELASKENKSAGEKQMMAKYVDQLNSSVEGLNLTYNDEADALNMSSKELQARVDLMREEEKGMAAQERLAEIEKERIETQQQLEEVNAKQAEWNELSKEGRKNAEDAKESLADLDEQEAALIETLDCLKTQQADTEEQIVTSTANMTQAIQDGNIGQIRSYDDLIEKNEDAFNKLKESYESLQKTVTNAFDKISTESEYSMDEMIENMEHNQKATEEWGENRAAIMEWASEKGHTGFMKWVDQLGIDQAGELAEMAKNLEEGTGEQNEKLEKLAELYDENTQTATDAMKQGLGDGFDNAVDMTAQFVEDTSGTMRSEMHKAKFDEIGEIAPREMSAGIGNLTSIVTDKMKTLSGDMKSPFGNSKIDFTNIGKNVMAGLKSGIDDNESNVLSAARRVAGNVAGAMRGVLAIRSPSRVMRDQVGKFIPEGVAVGIKDNAKSVYKELNALSNNMIKTSTPEQALGTSSMAYTDSGLMGSVGNSITNNRNRTYNPQITNYFTPAESTPSESARKQKQQLQRLAMDWR